MKSFQEKLNSNKNQAFGPFIRIPRPEIIEIAALSGADFVVVDLEHGGMISIDLVYPLVLAAKSHKLKIFIRIPSLQEDIIKSLLDLGVDGLQIPHVQTKNDIDKYQEFSKFSPQGNRGICRFVRSAEFSNISGVKYLKGNSENLITIIQIESIDGINNLSKILDNNLVDVVFFGPYDLSQSLGIPGKTKNTKVIEAIDNGIKIAQKHNVSSGIFCDNDEDREFWSSKGMDYIIFKIDVQIILDSFKTLYGKEIS